MCCDCLSLSFALWNTAGQAAVCVYTQFTVCCSPDMSSDLPHVQDVGSAIEHIMFVLIFHWPYRQGRLAMQGQLLFGLK